MDPTFPIPHNEIAADWFSAHPLADRLRRQRHTPPGVQETLKLLWPVSNDYFSPLHPIFLAEMPTIQAFRERSSWMIRDGLVPLLWFFKSNPHPPKARSGSVKHGPMFWVEAGLTDFVPGAWRSQVGAYQLQSSLPKKKSPAKSRRLLLTGLMMPIYCGLDSLQTQLDAIVAHYGRKALASMEILAFLPANFLDWGAHSQHEFHSEYMMRVCRSLGTRVRPVTWIELDAASSLKEFEVIDFNDGLLCRDSYLLHLALTRGARLAFENKRLHDGGEERFVALSPSHGVGLTDRLPAPRALPDSALGTRRVFERFESAMRSEANRRFPWPEWIPAWARMAK